MVPGTPVLMGDPSPEVGRASITIPMWAYSGNPHDPVLDPVPLAPSAVSVRTERVTEDLRPACMADVLPERSDAHARRQVAAGIGFRDAVRIEERVMDHAIFRSAT